MNTQISMPELSVTPNKTTPGGWHMHAYNSMLIIFRGENQGDYCVF